MRTVTESAPAKINWNLSVGEKMPNGYHSISTLMQTVSLCDEITITARKEAGIRLECEGDDTIPADSSNLAYRAASMFLTRAGIFSGLSIALKKRIPVAGGLAGGSADAAAVLRACNRMFDQRFSKKELLLLAAELGSDVPFCLIGGLVQCEGRGDVMTELPPPEPYSLLIVNCGEKISTAKAYAVLDTVERTSGTVSYRDIYHALEARDFQTLELLLQNDFSQVVLPLCPKARHTFEELRTMGALARMSGSGSSVFGVFSDERTARDAMSRLSVPSVFAVTQSKNAL